MTAVQGRAGLHQDCRSGSETSNGTHNPRAGLHAPARLAVALALLAAPAQASMVVVLVTPDRIVAASDSRLTRLDAAGREVGYSDDAGKLRLDGRFVMFGSGYVALPSFKSNDGKFLDVFGPWDRLRPTSGTARVVMDRLLAAVLGQRVVPPPGPTPIAQVGVFRFAGAVPDGRVVRVEALAHQPGKLLSDLAPTSMPYCFVAALTDAIADRVHAQLVLRLWLRPTEAEMVALARAAIAEGARLANSVGGPTHVVVVDASASRWIQE
jgi:hypothetical protein